MATPAEDSRRPSHSEILHLLEGGKQNEDLVMEYLREIAESYYPVEVFAVMALVDTPDVFD